MSRLALVAAVGLCVGLTAFGPAAAARKWVLFGDASFVKGGTDADHWAVQLRSKAHPGYGGVAWSVPVGLTFAGIASLSADFQMIAGDCAGGSPRFSIGLDTDGDGTRNGSVFVYLGPDPFSGGCGSDWQSTGNFIDPSSTSRAFDSTQLGGPFYGTYASTLASLASATVTSLSLVVDGSWLFGVQTVLVDNVNANGDILTAPNS